MWPVFQALLAVVCTTTRSRLSLQLEIVALRHQLSVYRRSVERPRIRPGDGGFYLAWPSEKIRQTVPGESSGAVLPSSSAQLRGIPIYPMVRAAFRSLGQPSCVFFR